MTRASVTARTAVPVGAEMIDDPKRLWLPEEMAEARGGVWLVELSDGTFVTALGDTLFSRPIGGAE